MFIGEVSMRLVGVTIGKRREKDRTRAGRSEFPHRLYAK
jgi:hypothetical protein